MNLAVSNIAWPPELDSEAADLLAKRGVAGVELAPTRYWPSLDRRETRDPNGIRSLWESHGLRIVALQALLYGKPELTVFGSREQRDATLEYLVHALDLAAELGAFWLVFGSPTNRRTGDRTAAEVHEIARDFFGSLGNLAAERGVVVGVEANPAEYGCDFLTRTADAVAFVRSLDNRGIGCHLDLGGMLLAGEPIDATIRASSPIGYVHASAPQLQSITKFGEAYMEAGNALRSADYRGWVSIEMRPAGHAPLEMVEQGVEIARAAFVD